MAIKAKTLVFFLTVAGSAVAIYSSCNQNPAPANNNTSANTVHTDTVWHIPDSSALAKEPDAELIRYGEKLIANTSYYLGPKGIVAHMSNGMNCQNCHQQAGTKTFGNNFGAVASMYPRFRPRSGTIENIYKRVNDCMQRSLNGKALDTTGKEMLAMTAYIKWVGKDVPKGKTIAGAGGGEIAYLDRAADTNKGEAVFVQKCGLCHGSKGAGLPNANGIGYQYPPLWGEHSYNNGAGILRLARLSTYVKNNMPFGADYKNPQLTDEEAWDVAAFINSQPRPAFDMSADWPDMSAKPIDYPYGPYADGFTEAQHKYGPYKPIVEARKQMSKKKNT
ncbi:MAG TPA: c-type cytochrome [Bacteroidia bacterium]|nr:c-type cytochrome [Bacteroidia bacterium]